MGHIPADREWVGSSEVEAVEESTDNKGEAVEKCKFTIGLAKKGLGLKSREDNKEAGVEVQQQTSGAEVIVQSKALPRPLTFDPGGLTYEQTREWG
ncbi:unnamed protein product [Tetraodon nigroviridis]|uniref:(spotted green pufferfish) hypothetical protein n=1 Tax=Tetraodon nigroviridis TaxID=99883 RepID=Q4RN40_TETNG|nr:unnamed protein product [Tetraodon nigroviridis]